MPKGTIARVSLGSSFAEYDRALMKAGVFVETPAYRAAVDQAHGKSFFIGRRGSGKTAITYYLLQRDQRNTIQLLPQIFSSLSDYFDFDGTTPLRQRCFRSLVACFKRAMEDEVIGYWVRRGHFSFAHATTVLAKERNLIEDCDFDLRLTTFVERSLLLLDQKNEREWLREIKRTKEIGSVMNELREDRRYDFTVIIDRVDEEWDGSIKAVVLLTALMHACNEIAASSNCVRPLLFLRENMFERVRDYDTEFTRLETAVVSLEWSRELLLELIERRLNLALTAKLPLHVPTWDCFFERV